MINKKESIYGAKFANSRDEDAYHPLKVDLKILSMNYEQYQPAYM